MLSVDVYYDYFWSGFLDMISKGVQTLLYWDLIIERKDEGCVEITLFSEVLFLWSWSCDFVKGFMFGMITELSEETWQRTEFMVDGTDEGPSTSPSNAV